MSQIYTKINRRKREKTSKRQMIEMKKIFLRKQKCDPCNRMR